MNAQTATPQPTPTPAVGAGSYRLDPASSAVTFTTRRCSG
jgi:hypothetical protein